MRLTAAAVAVFLSHAGAAPGSEQPRKWSIVNNTNACAGSASKPPTSWPIQGVPASADCAAMCEGNSTCTVFAWSPNSHTCYFRLDHTWATGWPNEGYVSGCVETGDGAVWGCGFDPRSSPCPSHMVPPATPPPAAPTAGCPWQVTGAVGGIIGQASEGFRMLGLNFDFWPNTKDKWGRCGVLTSGLSDPLFVALASRLNGSMLRIGGSPADFMVYDVFQGACSAANLNSTQPTLGPDGKPHGYFCPIWDQVAGQCLTMDRWAQVWGRQPLLPTPHQPVHVRLFGR